MGKPPADEPTVLFEDAHVLVVDKPAGLLSQGDRSGAPSLVTWAQAHVGRRYVGLVHRLDRNVSGVMVIAKRSKAAARLSSALREGTLRRTYVAWLEGTLPREATWRHWLVKDATSNRSSLAAPGAPHAREAVLHVRPMRTVGRGAGAHTLVELELDTGRSHQIRAQAAAAGHPVVGDAKYGASPQPRGRRLERAGLLLHSHRLSFPHPSTGAPCTWSTPLPARFAHLGAAADP